MGKLVSFGYTEHQLLTGLCNTLENANIKGSSPRAEMHRQLQSSLYYTLNTCVRGSFDDNDLVLRLELKPFKSELSQALMVLDLLVENSSDEVLNDQNSIQDLEGKKTNLLKSVEAFVQNGLRALRKVELNDNTVNSYYLTILTKYGLYERLPQDENDKRTKAVGVLTRRVNKLTNDIGNLENEKQNLDEIKSVLKQIRLLKARQVFQKRKLKQQLDELKSKGYFVSGTYAKSRLQELRLKIKSLTAEKDTRLKELKVHTDVLDQYYDTGTGRVKLSDEGHLALGENRVFDNILELINDINKLDNNQQDHYLRYGTMCSFVNNIYLRLGIPYDRILNNIKHIKACIDKLECFENLSEFKRYNLSCVILKLCYEVGLDEDIILWEYVRLIGFFSSIGLTLQDMMTHNSKIIEDIMGGRYIDDLDLYKTSFLEFEKFYQSVTDVQIESKYCSLEMFSYITKLNDDRVASGVSPIDPISYVNQVSHLYNFFKDDNNFGFTDINQLFILINSIIDLSLELDEDYMDLASVYIKARHGLKKNKNLTFKGFDDLNLLSWKFVYWAKRYNINLSNFVVLYLHLNKKINQIDQFKNITHEDRIDFILNLIQGLNKDVNEKFIKYIRFSSDKLGKIHHTKLDDCEINGIIQAGFEESLKSNHVVVTLSNKDEGLIKRK